MRVGRWGREERGGRAQRARDDPMRLANTPLISRRICLAATPMLAVSLLWVGCSSDDDAADDKPESAGSETQQPTSTTEPGASDTAAVRPHVEDLLRSWDGSMTAILGDPRSVVDDPAHRLRSELAASFTADSPYVRDLDLLLRSSYVDQDAGVRPGPNGVVQQTSLLHFTETPDEDHVGFVFCTYDDGVGFTLSTGADRSPGVGVTQGAGEAVRENGTWRLHRLRQLGFEAKPADSPNPCPDLVEAESGG